ncbi:MAG: aldehyde ferredoxin oxidoreductase family protein [Bacillota bacterium]
MTSRYVGRLLRIDVTDRSCRAEEIPEEIFRRYVGSRGLNMFRLFDELSEDTDPLGPDNKVIFGTGLLNGTLVPGTRFNVSAKSPQTGLVGDANAGGHFGSEMRFAGWDQIIIEGRSDEPVYIFVEDDSVQIRSAEHMWGRDVWETHSMIREELGDPDIQIACVGQAAENGVTYSGVFTNLVRAAARTGVGTVLASKKVKALAVRGHRPVKVADPEGFRELLAELDRRIYEHPDYASRSVMGTTRLVTSLNALGALVTRHFMTGYFPAADRVSGERLADEFNVKNRACFACTAPCSRWFIVREGPYRGLYGEGPEFEPLGVFTARVYNDDLGAALAAVDKCNRYGMDALTAGECIAMLMELNERGIISSEDAEGLDLSWGNAETMLTLLDRIAHQEGVGQLLREGSKKAAERIGKEAEPYAMHVKGLEIIQGEPRGLKGYGLGYCVASRGGDHLRAEPFFELTENAEESIRRYGTPKAAFPGEYEGKGKLVRHFEEWHAIIDSLNVCKNTAVCMEAMPLDMAAGFLNAVTGWDLTEAELRKAGERIINVERAFCIREGIERKHDRLPERFLSEPLPEECGPSAGLVFELEPMLDEYYTDRRWDLKRGWPTRQLLDELGLEDVREELLRKGFPLQ